MDRAIEFSALLIVGLTAKSRRFSALRIIRSENVPALLPWDPLHPPAEVSTCMTTTTLSEYVRNKLTGALGDDGLPAGDLLARAKFPLVEAGSELEQRIHLAFLKLALEPWNRETEPTPLAKFTENMSLGMTDWRDLLASAGLENDDWRDVLSRNGYEAPRPIPL